MNADIFAQAPTLQGVNSTTWRRPPLDGSLKVPELFRFHAEHSSNHPLFIYPMSGGKTRTIAYREAYYGIRRAATIVSDHHGRWTQTRQAAHPASSRPTIGILAVSETISFFTLIVGMMHLGLTPFPISIRNSAIATAHLMEKTGVQQLYVSSDAATQQLARQAREMLLNKGIDLAILPMPVFENLYNGKRHFSDKPIVAQDWSDAAIILHSSGSTAFPKPINLNHRYFLQYGIRAYFGELDVCGINMAIHALPMFHAMGTFMISCAPGTGLSIGCYEPSNTPIVPTPQNYLDALKATGSEIMVCVPAFLEEYSHSTEAIADVKKMKAVMYGGAPLSPELGQRLFQAGVPLQPLYAGTEFGVVSLMWNDPRKHHVWDYWQMSPDNEVELLPQEEAEDLFEPVVIASDRLRTAPTVFNTTINGKQAYATSDLLQKHPTLPGYWKVYGRIDDQLMLSTGEKTNPVPLEAMFSSDPCVGFALVFGRGRLQNGVLVQPKDPFDPKDEMKLAAFCDTIWSTVERVNEYAPSHSRIFKEMIIVTRPDRPFELTAKGTPRRQVCLKAYDDDIEVLYRTVAESAQVDVPIPATWTIETTTEFVRALVERVIKTTLRSDADMFQHGCDSLQATWIRNTLLQTLRTSTNVALHNFPMNVIYTYPTIDSLSTFIDALISEGQSIHGMPQKALKTSEMQVLLDKYCATLLQGHPRTPAEADEVNRAQCVLVTGTTGRLGSHLLSQLLQRAGVARIFALNRDAPGYDATLTARQRAAFEEWELDTALLESEKLSLITCDTSKDRLGLDEAVYDDIRDSVTDIVHNAWRVDFNLSLSSFEPLIMGMRNIIDLSLASPRSQRPHIVFVSSIGVLQDPSQHPVPEEPMMDPKTAVGTGYGESKWVAEQLCKYAMDLAGARTTIVRVGQVSGDTRIGGWNTKEWVAALVSASQVVGCLPSIQESISWVPVDIVAATLVDMLSYAEPVLHLVHPRPIEWDTMFSAVADKLGVPLVPYAQWLAALEALASNSISASGTDKSQETTGLALLEFFRSQTAGFERIRLSTDKGVRSSVTLAECRRLTKGDLFKSMAYWARAGILKLQD